MSAPKAHVAQSAQAKKTNLLEGDSFRNALTELMQPLRKPVRLLSVQAVPSQVVIQVRSITQPNVVQEYRYSDGKRSGPSPVKLLGTGKLSDNLFRLNTADPLLGGKVLQQVRSRFPQPIKKLTMVRNLPDSMDIQFRVKLGSENGDLIITADKHGRLLLPKGGPKAAR